MEVSRTHLERWSAWLRRAADLAETGRAEPEDFRPVIQEIADALSMQEAPAKPEQQRYITRRELAQMYNLSTGQAWAISKEPGFPSVKVGKTAVRIPVAEARQYMERRRG